MSKVPHCPIWPNHKFQELIWSLTRHFSISLARVLAPETKVTLSVYICPNVKPEKSHTAHHTSQMSLVNVYSGPKFNDEKDMFQKDKFS